MKTTPSADEEPMKPAEILKPDMFTVRGPKSGDALKDKAIPLIERNLFR